MERSRLKIIYNRSLFITAFTLTRAVLADSYEKKWKHMGIFTAASKKYVEDGILPEELLKEAGQLNRDLYHMQRRINYGESLNSFNTGVLEDYLFLMNQVFEVVKCKEGFRGS